MFASFFGDFLASPFQFKAKYSHASGYWANHLSIGHIDAKMAAECTKWKCCETMFRNCSHTVKLLNFIT